MLRAFANPVFVPYAGPLSISSRLLERRDRFVVEVALDDTSEAGEQVVLAHCINPGRMEAFVEPGARVWLLPAAKADRKLKYSWEAIETMGIDGERIVASTNTVRPNLLVRRLLEARCLPGLDRYGSLAAERKFEVRGPGGEAHSGRVDFLLDEGTPTPHYVEVKNCHLVYGDGWGYFPDSVSERATRHVDALAEMVTSHGARASVVLVVQRGDVRHGVRPSAFHDPTFAAAAVRAAKAGVQFRAVRAVVGLQGTELTHELSVDLRGCERPDVLADVARGWEANRATTGWQRGSGGVRVGNAAFAHHVAAEKAAARAEAKVAKQAKAADRAAARAEKSTTKGTKAEQASPPATAPAPFTHPFTLPSPSPAEGVELVFEWRPERERAEPGAEEEVRAQGCTEPPTKRPCRGAPLAAGAATDSEGSPSGTNQGPTASSSVRTSRFFS